MNYELGVKAFSFRSGVKTIVPLAELFIVKGVVFTPSLLKKQL